MNRFKVGDKVTLISVDRYAFRYVDDMKQLFGRTLVVRSVHYDQFTPVVFAGVPGDVCWNWYPDDLQLVSEPDADPKPSEHFRVGDYVVLIAGPDKSDKVHVITESGDPDYPLRVAFCTYMADGRLLTCGNSSYMRHATAKEISAMQKPKRLRWGDLVVCNGEIHMVFDDHPDEDGDYRILCLTMACGYSYMPAKDMSRVGSIRKKIKRLKQERKA